MFKSNNLPFLKAFRLIIVFIWFLISCLFGLFLSLIRPFHPSTFPLIGKFFSTPMLPLCGIDLELRGGEYFNERPYVIVSNHQNNMDLIIMGKICPTRTVTLGKKEILLIPLFGLMYWLGGNIFIDRQNLKKAKHSMNKVTQTIRDRKINVWVMPEGTRNWGRGLLPFKKGAFKTAIDAQIPIVPICFSSYGRNLYLNKLKSGRVIARVLRPIETKGLGQEDIEKIKNQCHQMMEQEIANLDQEVESL